ncbi:aromatic acid exporter family protein [Streptomyces sp. NPDC088354]|uniref:FUSC family protein n=1 Tax=unclassified Streptomyces TaxID=2593676 RepID=UPI0029B55AA2|nr:aromatic acid exporter family protein [Streptomyces sp. MI02-7b]MDX3071397.1 aromatic acid exporter family protein [Streptomyces sp. MI02-7b]
MPAGLPPRAADLVRLNSDPIAVQTVRSTVAAVLSYAVAVWVLPNPAPLTAPLTALLVVQVTLYTTVTTGIRRVLSVVAGVLIAVGFSELIGLTWWSLGLIILASLVTGHFIRVDEFVAEVAISAMLILAVPAPSGEAVDRVMETLVGAAVGVLLNVVVPPPAFVEPAGEAVRELAEHMRLLMVRMGGELRAGATAERARTWLMEARRLDNEIARFDASLRRAEEGTRLNPRVRPAEGAMARLILRSGLDTLEVSTVLMRTLCRSLTEMERERGPREPLFSQELADGMDELFADMADAVDSYGRLIAAQVTAGAEQAEARLEDALRRGREERDRIAALLWAETERRWENWDLHGALLANIDRLLNELDLEQRSRWLSEQLVAAAPSSKGMSARVHRRARAITGRLRRGAARGR